MDSTTEPKAEGSSTSQWYVTTYGIPRSDATAPAYCDARGGGECAWTTSADKPRRLPRIRGVIGVCRKMNRGLTRTTRKPSIVSSADSARSCWDVTTVTSCPRRASSLESDRTWLSTPPKCGENQGDTWAIRTPITSEDPAPRRDVSPRVGPRAKEGLFPDDGTRVDRRVDAHLHVVPHDHAKLPQSGVDLDPAEHDLHGRLVESEVRHLRARAEVASLTEDAVAHVVLMGQVGGGHQDRILHLAGVPDFRLGADGRGRPDVTVRSDLRFGSDDRRTLDVRAAPDGRALLHQDLADQCRARIHLAVRCTLQRSQQGCIGPQEIPRSPHVDPFRRETESIDIALRHQETDCVRDLEFAPGRFRRRVDEGEDVLVEHVDARIDQVRFRLPRFFLEGRDLLVLHLHHAEGTRIWDFRQGHDWPAHLPTKREQFRKSLSRYDHIAIHAEESAFHVRAHASACMGCPQAFALFLVCDGEIQGRPVPEPFPNPMPLPSDQDGEVLDSRRAQRLEAVTQKRLAGHR